MPDDLQSVRPMLLRSRPYDQTPPLWPKYGPPPKPAQVKTPPPPPPGPKTYSPSSKDAPKLKLPPREPYPVDAQGKWLPVKSLPVLYDTWGRRLCGARKRSDWTRCRQLGECHNGRCRFHGARAARGRAHRWFKNGMNSRYDILPGAVKARYEQARADPELLSHRDEVALLSARVVELAGRIGRGDSGQLWKRLHDEVALYDTADAKQRDQLVARIKKVIATAADDEAAWKELFAAGKERAAMADLEWKRLLETRQVLTAEKAVAFAQAVVEAVLRHVPEPERRIAVRGDIVRILNHQDRRHDTADKDAAEIQRRLGPPKGRKKKSAEVEVESEN